MLSSGIFLSSTLSKCIDADAAAAVSLHYVWKNVVFVLQPNSYVLLVYCVFFGSDYAS